MKFCRDQALELIEVQAVEEIPGHGMKGQCEGVELSIGRVFDYAVDGILATAAKDHQKRGSTIVWLGYEQKIVGFVVLRDDQREGVQAVVDYFKHKKIKTALISGDSQKAVDQLVSQMGFTQVAAQMLPQDKLLTIETLQQQNEVVAMVGDGVNDAAALKKVADVGIAMGALGADIALESSDVMIMKSEIEHVNYLHHLARRTMSLVWQNIFFASSVAIALVVFILLGRVNMGWAVALHEGSSVVVALNALRLLRD